MDVGSAIIIGAFFGCMMGTAVAIFGAVRGCMAIAIGGFFMCVLAGSIGGMLLAVPVGAGLIYAIIKQTPPPPPAAPATP